VRVPELDGLRGCAIGLVLLYHFYLIPAAGTTPGTFWAYVSVPGRLAWSGVDLFFVLSGFLIGGILLDEKFSPNYFRAFYARRFFRIIPMYTLALLFFYGVALLVHLGYANGFVWMLTSQLPWPSYALFLQNFWMVLRDTLGPLTLGVTWSLAIEEQFYLTLPLLVRVFDRRKLILAVISGIALAPVFRVAIHFMGPHYRQGIAVLMPCRADALLLGVASAIMMRTPAAVEFIRCRRRELLLVTGLLCLGFVWLTLYSPYTTQIPMLTFGFTLIAAMYACFLLYGINFPQTVIGKFLKLRWLRSLGLIAYGLYLLHFPVLAIFFGLKWGREPFISSVSSGVFSTLALAVTILICALSWVYFEKPLVKLGHRISYRSPSSNRVGSITPEAITDVRS